MEDKKNKKILKMIMLIVLLIIVVGIGLTIAYFTAQSLSNTQTITTGGLSIVYEDDSSADIEFQITEPIYDEEIEDKATKIQFRAHSYVNEERYLNISIEEIEMAEELKTKDFRWALYETDSTYSNIGTKIADGDFTTATDVKSLKKDITVAGKAIKYYTLYLWLRETDEKQIGYGGKEFSGKIVIYGNEEKSEILLSEQIKKDNAPIKEYKPDFGQIATADEGLIKDKDDDGDTYYFRGAVEDNYVKFNGLKWAESDGDYHKAGDDMLWRIVRINGDGTIRLIADGSIGNSAFNENSDNEKYLGYTYDNTTNRQDSTIKTVLDKWYSDNMTDYDQYIEKSKFCNDTSTITDEDRNIEYGAMDRILVNQPSFKCSKSDKSYGGLYTDLKVGLITADEVMFAGGDYPSMNESYYLYGKSDYLWTISPINNLPSVWCVADNGAMYMWSAFSELAVRPAVNLKTDLMYTEGNGAKNSPYLVG